MKKIINKVLATGAIALAATACTGDYLEINSNQFEPGDLTADNYALMSSMTEIFSSVIPSNVNRNQFTDCLMGGTLGGYFSDGNGNFTNSFARYNPGNGWSRVLMEASQNSMIPTLYTNLSMVEDYCRENGLEIPVAIAKIVKVAAMNRVTDTYGPIPYSKIGYDGNILTPYDSQQQVYNKFFEELDEAKAVLIENQEVGFNALMDEVYQGDLKKWIKYANALQLRLAMRISYADPAKAKERAEAAVNPANGGIIENNAESALWNHYEVSTNAMRTAIMYNNQDSRPSAEITCYMNGYNDPRISEYVTETNWKDDDGNFITAPDGSVVRYAGVRRGWTSYNAVEWGVKFSGIVLDPHAPAQWLNAAEVAFLRAEGAAVFNWDMGGSAEEFYNQGIKLSFEQYGVGSAADAYIADNTSVPAQYYDPSGVNSYNGSLPALKIKWDESATIEEKQQRIITQKWLANYTIGNEAWADYRRTGYPVMIPVAYNGSAGVVDTNRGPQRMPYPQEEYTNNGANVQQAVSQYLLGPDNQGTKLWWACKPGL